ncbi:SPOR domain-containing protein [Tritonibacter mobilis]|uniref:SPOR domain-containing protein n=1 Tax=Tritonibacter mobilis TaxID=379347 RepID=UPI001CDA5186|nr:SPOR domain-containing protein [Tritonibacter mobilis]MCA2009438.1 SPOR domain-containing protein [Tritonibacter mobilis]
MAYFAQVGAGAPSSNGDGDSGGSAFDPFSSHQYSRAPDPVQSYPAEPEAEPVAQTSYPSFGISQSPTVNVGTFSGVGGATGGASAQGGYPEAGYDYVGDYGDGYGGDEAELFAPPPGRSELGRMAAFLGAAASIALVVSISMWGYKLIMRDVSGVPVVSALSGPMRIAPENPGGELADNQGLAVNSVAANGIAEDPADRLQLAPEAIALTEDDQPIPTLTQAAEEEAALEAEYAAQDSGLSATVEDPEEVAEVSPLEQRNNDIDALVASLTEDAIPLEDLRETSASITQPAPLDTTDVAAITTVPAAVRNAPGVRETPRPLVRPARFSPAPAPASGTAAVQPARGTVDIDPKSLEVGTRLAQLGAYESAEVARSEWTRISAKFGEFFDDKARVVQRAESGGRIFYRLRAHGFEDLSDARRFCSALVAGNADCIPVTMR